MVKDFKDYPKNDKDLVYQIYLLNKKDDNGNDMQLIDFAKYYDDDWHYESYLGYENNCVDIHEFTHYNDTPLNSYFPWIQ